jgi:hypothetical protein
MASHNFYFNEKTVYRDKLVPVEKTVTEVKAPTDDSIRLFNEMRDKAEKTLMDGFEVKNSAIDATVAIFRRCDMMGFGYGVHYRIKLNDHVIDGDFPYKVETYNRDELLFVLLEKFAGHVTEIVTNELKNVIREDEYRIIGSMR